MGKRLMTLSDLYNYYSSQGKTQKFSCNNDGDTIVVQVDGKLDFSKNESTDGLYPTRVQMNFVGDNLNNSRIEMKAQEAALSSSHYRPLLACIHEVDGEPQFWGHNMHQDENGEIVYDEQPVGVIAEEAHIEHDDEYDMDYAVAQGYIWEEYSKAAYILERDKKCDVSVELSIRSLSYDAKDEILVLDDFYYSGCTILGYDEEGKKVNPAMPGSNITLADFSVDKKDFNENIVEMLNKLYDKIDHLSSYTKENSKEGGNMSMFETLLEKYGKTVEDITFDYENMTDEELESKFAELFEDDVDDDSDAETDPSPEEGSSEDTDGESDDEAGIDAQELEDEEVPIGADDTMKKVEYSITVGDTIKEFSVSMNAKIEALSTLVNDTYADDMTWYCVEVYDDDKQIVMIDYWTGKAYRQSYKVKEDVFSLKGDRVEVYSTWMTADEQKAFDKMKADFSEIQTKLERYETEPSKMEVINSEEYSQIADTEEFKAFANQDAHFEMSVEEVKSHMDEMLLDFAKKGSLHFSNENKKDVEHKNLLMSNKKVSRYGNLFSK